MREEENKQMSFGEYVKLYRMLKGGKSYDRGRGSKREREKDKGRARTNSEADRQGVFEVGMVKIFNLPVLRVSVNCKTEGVTIV